MVTLGAGECVEVISIVMVVGEHHWQLEGRAGGAERPLPRADNLTHKFTTRNDTCASVDKFWNGGKSRGEWRGLCSQLRHLDLL